MDCFLFLLSRSKIVCNLFHENFDSEEDKVSFIVGDSLEESQFPLQ